MPDSLRSHSVLCLRDLEPSELGTILPSPLSHVLVNVIGDVLKGLSVILAKVHSLCSGILHDYWKLQFRIGCCNAAQHVAKFYSSSILNSKSKDIRNEEHEISFVNVFHSKD